MNKEDYLRTEIRDGYQVSVTRKKVWLCELEMATWFCNVCEKYGLSYFLIGGSAKRRQRGSRDSYRAPKY